MAKNQETSELTRRTFLKSSAVVGAVALGAGLNRQSRAEEGDLGVASGDPLPNSVVLWTHIPTAFQIEGGQSINFEVSESPDFDVIVSEGQASTDEDRDFTIRVRAESLQADTWYYYRFSTESGYISEVGRTRTAPATREGIAELKIAFVSCQLLDHGLYNVYAALVEDDLDLIMQLGDNIYEHSSGSADDYLASYREIHQMYLARPELREARRLFPWIHIWDDHEVFQNYAGTEEMSADQRDRQMASYQAFSEYLPLDPSIVLTDRGDGIGELKIYRNYAFGSLLEVFALDGRQYRSPRVCGDDSFVQNCPELQSPDRTMLGREQTDWLKAGLLNSESTWKIIANGTMMMEMTMGGLTSTYFVPLLGDNLAARGDGLVYNADQWDGFPANRHEILSHVESLGISNLVVCTGDMHNCYAGELAVDSSKRHRANSVGVELVGGSVTSNGFGEHFGRDMSAMILASLHVTNPHFKYVDGFYHCYTRLHVTPEEIRASYISVSTVKSENFEFFESKAFIIPEGESVLKNA